jgi:phage protein D
LAGRDLTSLLIDRKRAIEFVGENLSSGIVAKIAQEVGLTPVVTATSKPAGTFYQILHKLIASDITYWDLVTRLAEIEQYQVYVKGHELHFEPRTAPDSDPYVIQWQKPTVQSGSPVANVTEMRFSRNLSIAKDIKVRVLSWNPKTNKQVDETAERKRVYSATTSKATKYNGPAQEYTYRIPGLTNDQAQRRAQQILDDLSKHEVNLHVDMPGDTLLTPRNIIKVVGTGTAFDQTYFPTSITRSYGLSEGFAMSVQAKNQTPNNPT